MNKKVGLWKWDTNHFPMYQYTGGYPVIAKNKAGEDSGQPEDPCFILGNYKMTLFVHASGMYEFITGERGWARLNQAGLDYGWNQSVISFGKKVYELVGSHLCAEVETEQYFGVGFAWYHYAFPETTEVTKVISVRPSTKCGEGNAAFLMEVTVENKGTDEITVNYCEQILSNYQMMSHQGDVQGSTEYKIAYENQIEIDEENQLVKAKVSCRPQKLMLLPNSPKECYTYDCYPPELFLKVVGSKQASVCSEKTELGDVLSASFEMTLAAGTKQTVRMVIGCNFKGSEQSIDSQIADMRKNAKLINDARIEGAYAWLWKRVLPDFADEKNEKIQCEMIWNAYVLECMATYNQYFDETYVPQGSVYAYSLGQNASNRDHLQHLLPLIYTNPKLAKSCIRFAMKHTLPDGEICRQDIGYGYRDPGIYMESDAQIYMFMAVGEYLRITKDYGFLQETLQYYPVEYGRKDMVLHFLMKQFIYLRDTIRTGQHGLVRMLNSDWSDSFFHPYSPNIYWHFAESHMNTTMLLATMPVFVKGLEAYVEEFQEYEIETKQFIEEMKWYREKIYRAFMKDMEGRTYAPRCYLCEHDEPELKFGMDTLCIESQPFILQMEDFPLERKQKLLEEIKCRVLDVEKMGARTREVPLWDEQGHAEDGGIWFSHQGALIAGMVTFDKDAAMELLKKLSFHHFAEEFPEYWLGHWTYADSMESSFNEQEGLYRLWNYPAFQPFCAHAHAWMLYGYYRIKE